MSIYLCSQDVVHRQYIYHGVDRERSLDLGIKDLLTPQFEQLFDLVLGGGGSLERHVSGSTVCTEVCLIRIFGRGDSVLRGRTDKAVRSTIPEQRLGSKLDQRLGLQDDSHGLGSQSGSNRKDFPAPPPNIFVDLFFNLRVRPRNDFPLDGRVLLGS